MINLARWPRLVLWGVCSFLIAVGSARAADAPLRAGIIGLDAHAASWVKIINDPNAKGELADMVVVAGVPAGSKDIPQSQQLLKKGVATFEQLGVELIPSIEKMLAKVDVVMVLSIDGRPHWAQTREVILAGKPVFVDKPMAASVADAMRIFRLAAEKRVPCFSSSSLRFSPSTQQVCHDPSVGAILGCDAHSPCAIEPHHPDLFWYGIHGVETLFTIMGPGCRSVSRVATADADVVVGVWHDGRIGTFRGHRTGPHTYGASVFGSKRTVESGAFEGYEPLIEEIVKCFKTGKPPITADQTLEILAFMKAADLSKQGEGRAVALSEVLDAARKEVDRDRTDQ